ncbi:transcriptional regulator, HxlR family [Chitinophaga sp. CF118]|uniref:winged helix-turn-helix transcriptional regulator n=1 Tax=Chitinophaga sp. CF118 TaxID=1884367 RepID=UPI0008F0B9B8|nr:helix-turn-helix domain-containing protein [Chitinophaga sp. CF118]SFE46778.1 transcriptional regulator, HxlR family [Chitinophaga sp. CF118]
MKDSKKKAEAPVCSIDYAFRRIGGKYKGRILVYLWRNNVLRYGALRRSIIDITPKMLTQTLRELEEDELICRAVFHELPPRVEYSLTNTGLRLVPFINELKEWGDRQLIKGNIPSLAPLEADGNNPKATC